MASVVTSAAMAHKTSSPPPASREVARYVHSTASYLQEAIA